MVRLSCLPCFGGKRSTPRRRRGYQIFLGALCMLLLYLLLRSTAQRIQQSHLQALFLATAEIFQECSVDHWFDFGTLLGLWRDGNPVIPADTDVDVQLASWEDRTRLLECGEALFTARGFHLDRTRNTFGGLRIYDEQSYYVDIDTWIQVRGGADAEEEEEEEQLQCVTLPYCQPEYLGQGGHTEFCRIRKDLILPTQTIHWRGQAARIPRDVEALLLLRYGPDWRTPKKFDKGTDTTPWDTFKASIHPLVEFGFVIKTLFMVCLAHLRRYAFLWFLVCGSLTLWMYQNRNPSSRGRVFQNLSKGMHRLSTLSSSSSSVRRPLPPGATVQSPAIV